MTQREIISKKRRVRLQNYSESWRAFVLATNKNTVSQILSLNAGNTHGIGGRTHTLAAPGLMSYRKVSFSNSWCVHWSGTFLCGVGK